MMQGQGTTVDSLLRRAAQQLQAEGLAGSDARPLLAEVLGVSRDRLVLMGPDPVSAAQEARFEAMMSQRLARVPVSKILGWRLFWGRRFEVTADTLDPRPETESLIAEALAGPVPAQLLDLGTGTGCIALTLLAEWPGARGLACDISAAALAVARRNAEGLGLTGRCDFLQSDWFTGITGSFDLILSNPPYIAAAEMADLSPEVQEHDPHLALSPGGDGLSPYLALAMGARAHLNPGGRLLVEIGWQQGAAVAEIFAKAGLEEVRILPDMDGRDRVVCACQPAQG